MIKDNMESEINQYGRLSRPLKPEKTLAELEQEDPEFAAVTRTVLFGLSGFVHFFRQEHQASPGLERVDDLVRNGYDAGLFRVLWTTDCRLSIVLVWSRHEHQYRSFGLSPNRPHSPVVFCRTATGWEMLNMPEE